MMATFIIVVSGRRNWFCWLQPGIGENMRTAVIIAGGKSLRLMPLTSDKPKTLVEVMHKPILYWIVKWLKQYGIGHVVLAVAYKREEIYKFMKANDNFGLEVDFSNDMGEGTAPAFKLAIERFVKDEDFIAMNSDELTNMDLSRMIERHAKYRPLVTMALSPLHCRLAVVKVDGGNKITGFEYGKLLPSVLVSVGIYAFNRRILKYITGPGSIEDMVFRKLANEGRIVANRLTDKEEWCTINTLKDVEEAEEILKKWGRS
jgi:NDP-sugar pyrophosphorylase family protein